MVVLHYTGMQSGDEALARMCDPEAKVSAHYMIDEDGTVTRWCPRTSAPGTRANPIGAG
jgi:N-acetylmuramoyl-L-alanine amidase